MSAYPKVLASEGQGFQNVLRCAEGPTGVQDALIAKLSNMTQWGCELLSPPQVRMKNTSSVRSTSRVRSETPIVACSAMENGACGIAEAAINANGAQCCGKYTLQCSEHRHDLQTDNVFSMQSSYMAEGTPFSAQHILDSQRCKSKYSSQ